VLRPPLETTPELPAQFSTGADKRPGDFDVIVVYRVDWIVRRVFGLADFTLARGTLRRVSYQRVSPSSTSPHRSATSNAPLVAKVAGLELAAMRERNRSAAQHRLRAGMCRGGPAPWG
jgi:site-specific DNA recombinase